MLPQNFKKYFWDCDFNSLVWESHKFFITERILNFGEMDSVKWLLLKLSKKDLLDYVKKSKNIDSKTKNYWEIIL